MRVDISKAFAAGIATFFSLALVYDFIVNRSGCLGGYDGYGAPLCGPSAVILLIILFILLNSYSFILILRRF